MTNKHQVDMYVSTYVHSTVIVNFISLEELGWLVALHLFIPACV